MSLRPLQIAAGAIIGALIGAAAVVQVGPGPIQGALSDAVAGFHALTRGDAAAAPPPNGKALQRDAAEQAQAKNLRDEQARQLRADQQKASGGAGNEALEAAARKERAWNRFYKKPSQCDGNPTSDVMTECANHYIRAKREFESAYAAGKL
jgi:hypothetical protein